MLLDSLRYRRMLEWKTEDSVPTYHTRYSRKIIDDRRSKSGDGEFRDAPGKGNHRFRIASSKRAARQSGEKENRFHRSWFFDNCNIRNLWAMLNCALYERVETVNPHCIYIWRWSAEIERFSFLSFESSRWCQGGQNPFFLRSSTSFQRELLCYRRKFLSLILWESCEGFVPEQFWEQPVRVVESNISNESFKCWRQDLFWRKQMASFPLKYFSHWDCTWRTNLKWDRLSSSQCPVYFFSL